jgi:hypothetical protein
VILNARVDVLMFMALPTEKFTILLSQHRLAPTQIVFGVGHPLTSASLAIDYTILSQTMMPDPPYNFHPLTEISSSERSFGLHCAAQVDFYLSRYNLSISSLRSQSDYGLTHSLTLFTHTHSSSDLSSIRSSDRQCHLRLCLNRTTREHLHRASDPPRVAGLLYRRPSRVLSFSRGDLSHGRARSFCSGKGRPSLSSPDSGLRLWRMAPWSTVSASTITFGHGASSRTSLLSLWPLWIAFQQQEEQQQRDQ